MKMAFPKENYYIEMLSDDNYATWKFRFEMLIRENFHDVGFNEMPKILNSKWIACDKTSRTLASSNVSNLQIIHILH